MERAGRVVVAGASGLIGTALGPALARAGYTTVGVSRSPRPLPGYTRVVTWDPSELGPWVQEVDGALAVINLSGSSIGVRLTPQARRQVLDSRVGPTLALGQAISSATDAPRVWINASAVGIYGSRGDQVLTEASELGDDREFLVHVGRVWEEATRAQELPNTRVIQLRLGLVLDNPRFIGTLRRLVQWFLGGNLGSGRQYVSWIMMSDVLALVHHLLEGNLAGPINATAPIPVRNCDLMGALRKELGRPWSPPVPKPAVWLFGKLFGPDAEVALSGQRVVPAKALESGFRFQYPEFPEALRAALRNIERTDQSKP